MKRMLMVASTSGHFKQFHTPYIEACGKEYVVDVAYPQDIHERNRQILSPNGEDISLPFRKKYLSFSNIQALFQLISLLKRKKYETIITHTTLASFILRLALLLSGEKTYLIYVVHGYLFHENSSFLKKKVFLNLERLLAPTTDLLLTMNEWDTDIAKSYHLGKRIEKISGMGVKTPVIEEKQVTFATSFYQLPIDKFLVMYGGEFSKRKNQKFLLDVFRHLPDDIHLVLIGEGQEVESLITRGKQYKISHKVHFLGQVPHLPTLYTLADLVVSSSQSEGLPFHGIEAMALGKCLLLSDIKGHRDLLPSTENNILFSLDHPQDFIEKVLYFKNLLTDQNSVNTSNILKFQETYELNVVFPEIMSYYLQQDKHTSSSDIIALRPTKGGGL